MKCFSVLLAAVLALSMIAAAQTKGDLVGVWRLVSATSTRPNGERVPLYGNNPSGQLTYTREGRMSVVLVDGARKPLSTQDRQSAPAAERAEAFSNFNAYAGRYTFQGDRVIHHVEIALFQNWVHTDQVRFATLKGDRLTLRTGPVPLRGEQRVQELVWERVK